MTETTTEAAARALVERLSGEGYQSGGWERYDRTMVWTGARITGRQADMVTVTLDGDASTVKSTGSHALVPVSHDETEA